MSERLHYFTEATTPVSFDCDHSDIDSDLDDLSRRPITEHDRAKFHARQLQLWSDEARRRRSFQSPPPPPPLGHRRISLTNPHIHNTTTSITPPHMALPPAATNADRQQSNLSERARHPSRRVSRSQSAKNLRIRVTPSSSSKSLLSDIESELGHSTSMPQSPVIPPAVEIVVPLADSKLPTSSNKTLSPSVHRLDSLDLVQRRESLASPPPFSPVVAHTATPHHSTTTTTTTSTTTPAPAVPSTTHKSNKSFEQTRSHASTLSRRLSFSRRVKPFSSLRRLLRRS